MIDGDPLYRVEFPVQNRCIFIYLIINTFATTWLSENKHMTFSDKQTHDHTFTVYFVRIVLP